MLNFYGFMIFICVLIILPILINIFDNLFNIFKILNNRISVLDKVLEFDNMELSDFALEFLMRAYNYRFKIKNDSIYLYDDFCEWFLYYDNNTCNVLSLYDVRNIIGICESKGCKNIFIFTTGIINDDIRSFLDRTYSYKFKFIHGDDLKLDYSQLVNKFYIYKM